MSSLFASLGLSERALQAQQFGLQITQKNIANANTPSYSRQRANLIPADPVTVGSSQLGTGVVVGPVESFRNRFLDYRITQEQQFKGEFSSKSSALDEVESFLNSSDSRGLDAALASFFNSFSSLANTPEDITLRQQVLVRAEELGQQFGRVYDKIQNLQMLQNRAVDDTVKEINFITSGVADLNARIAAAQALKSTDEPTLRDQRQELVDRLAGLVDFSYFETDTGMFTILTRRGSPLVESDQSHPMQTAFSANGRSLLVQLDGVDITPNIASGELGGTLQVRDTILAGYLKSLDDTAAALISEVNAQHALGSDYSGTQGGDFFIPFTQPVPGSNEGAAKSIVVAIADPKLIAAASLTGGPGSNLNAQALAGIRDRKLPALGSASLEQNYANFLFKVGADSRLATDGLNTQDAILLQLQNQRDTFSGVSLDEEAVNIIRYQKAYESTARFMQVVNGLTDEILRLVGT